MLGNKEIIKLINDGFDPELIAFEFDVPKAKIDKAISDLENIRLKEEEKNRKKMVLKQERENKKMAEKERKEEEKIKAKEQKENEKNAVKLQEMKNKYQELLQKGKSNCEIKQSEEEEELINKKIDNIEFAMQKFPELDEKKVKRDTVSFILAEIFELENHELTYKQADKICDLLNSKILSFEELNKIRIDQKDKIGMYVYNGIKKMQKKLVKAIDIEQEGIEDIGKLEELKNKIPKELQKENVILVGGVYDRIDGKISKIKRAQIDEKRKNDTISTFGDILSGIANGKVDEEYAKDLIEKEAQNRSEEKSNKRVTISKEQEKQRIYMEIKKIIEEDIEEYKIEDSTLALEQIQNIFGVNNVEASSVIVKNLIKSKRYDEAKMICKNTIQDDTVPKEIKLLQKEIKNEEIADMVLKGLNMEGTEEQKGEYFALLEKGIKMGNIDLSDIKLAKRKDGFSITLFNIWSDEKFKNKNGDAR